MKKTETHLIQQAVEALRSALAGVPFVEILSVEREVSCDESRADVVLGLELPEGPWTLVVEAKRSGQPRLARDGVNQLMRWVEGNSCTYGVFAAPYISERGAAICRDADIGYVDFSGNCRLCFQGVYVERTGNPNEFAKKKELRSLYAPKASRVLRVLLSNPGRRWKVQELSTEADVSLGHVSNVKQMLEDREWVSSGTEGLELTAPWELLREWSENYSYRDNEVRNYYCVQGVPEIERQVASSCAEAGQRYALTMFSGAVRLGAAARYKRVFAYVEAGQEEIGSRVGLKSVSSGANVSLLTPYDAGVFYGAKDFDGARVASPVQVFLDLKGFRGRGEETAQALFRERIRSQW